MGATRPAATPAAIVMAMIRAVVRTYPGVADDPPAVLHYINRHFEFLWDTPIYATAAYAVVDAARGRLRLSSAGHPLPLIASRDGTMFDVERLSEAVARHHGQMPPAIVDAIVAELESFSGEQQTQDDQTLLVVGFQG